MTLLINPHTRHLRSNFQNGLFIFLISLFLSACGGGGGGGGGIGGGGGGSIAGGIGGTGSVAAIASVTVNGVKFSCVGATVTNDDGTIDQGPGDNCVAAQTAGRLAVGSVVTVTGTTDASGNNPTATTVDVSRSVSGPVASLDVNGQSFSVLNQTILVDQTTRFVGVAGLSSLTNGTIVEVSGFRQNATATLPNGAILATLVQTKSSSSGQFELKGFASVSGSNVTINGVAISLASQSAPTNGQCVEAKGSFSGNTLTLTQALKSDNDCNGASALSGSLTQAQVEGVITAFSSVSNFTVGGQAINGGSASILGGLATDLLNGVKVEVKGKLSNGVLNATQIEIKSNGVRIEGITDSGLSGGSFTILGITVKVVTGTENDLGNFGTGTQLRVEGSKSGPNSINASKISNASGGGGGGTRTELRGPLDADASSTRPNVTILMVPVQTSASTQFNGSSSTANADAFFAGTKKDQIVKGRGTENTNNVITADEVENED